MERMYSYDELAIILGCTRTAIAKKVKPDELNPSVERYKNRYNVVIHDGKKCIVIDDEGLEEEKSKSKGFKNVAQNVAVSAETQATKGKNDISNEIKSETVSDVTERYIDKFVTLQQHLYNQIHDRDKQILLLTVDEKQKQDAYLQTQAENSELREKYNVITKKYNVAMNVIKIIITLCIICATSFITFKLAVKNVSQPVQGNSGQLSVQVIPKDGSSNHQ